MNTRSITVALFWGILSVANAQMQMEELLQSVEQNNTTLKALREQAKADKLQNKTGLTPENPEIAFGYLWGSPAGEMDNELSYSFSQSFDFPSAYIRRSKLANAKKAQVDLLYEQQRREVLHEARATCINWVYRKKVEAQFAERLLRADELFDAGRKMLDAGETTIIEYNKTRLNRLSLQKAAEFNALEIAALEDELRRLNGNTELPRMATDYPLYSLPAGFETWFAAVKGNNSSLAVAAKEVEISRQEEKLRFAENLPKLSAGYYSEHVLGRRLRGVQAGISLPLWEGKNVVKQQKAKTAALQTQQEDRELQFRNRMKSKYDKALKLLELLNEYRNVLDMSGNLQLLDKALETGQLTLTGYIQELTVYYETLDCILEKEWEYNQSAAELKMWEAR